jgi:type II secretory pathway component PulC
MPLARLALRPGAAAGQYELTRDDLLQIIALASAKQLPLEATTKGYRVRAVELGSMLALGGFQAGDEITRVGEVSPLAPDLLVRLHPLIQVGSVEVVFLRAGQERRHRFAIVTDALPAPAPRPRMPAFDAVAFEGMVTKRDGGVFELKRAAIDMLFDHPEEASRLARVVPVMKGEGPEGLRVMAIRRGSALDLLGLKNGDVIKSINGFEVSSPDKALEAYAAMRDATDVRFVLERAGKPVTLRYLVVE